MKHIQILQMTNYSTPQKDTFISGLKIVFTILFFIYLGIMIYFSLIPGDELIDTLIPKYSAILHFLEFMGLSIIAILCLALYNIKRPLLQISGLIIIMSILTESIQYFVPGRFFNVIDLCINLFGGLILIVIMIYTQWRKK